jgi:hypothetical protein
VHHIDAKARYYDDKNIPIPRKNEINVDELDKNIMKATQQSYVKSCHIHGNV